MGGLAILLYGAGVLGCVLVALFLVVTAYIAYIHWKYSHIPSPERPSFYFGHLPDVWKLEKERSELPWTVVVNYWKSKVESSTFVIYLAHDVTIVTFDPEVVKVLCMNKDNPKPKQFYEMLHTTFGQRFLGDGLASVTHYNKWKPRRALYDTAFKKGYLKSLVSTFNESTSSIIEQLRPLADGKSVVPLKKYIQLLTFDVISKVAFGTDFSKTWTEDSLGIKMPKGSSGTIFQYIMEQAAKALNESFASPFPSLTQYFNPSKTKEYKKCIAGVRRIGRDCIMRRVEMIKAGEEIPKDILSCILSSGTENPNIEEMVDDFATFYFAGQETTANTIAFALILLIQHPNTMERLLQEINEVLGSRTTVTYDDLEKLQYLDQVINETLRLYPAGDSIGKCLTNTTVIGQYSFTAGTDFLLMGANISRLPQYFEDPDDFNPDRFHPDNKKPSSFVYFPFGIGHRSCIGKHFALMEGKIALASILQSFHIQLPPEYILEVIQRTTLQPKGDLPCTMTCK